LSREVSGGCERRGRNGLATDACRLALAKRDQGPLDDAVQRPREDEREHQAEREIRELGGGAAGGDRSRSEPERDRVRQVERIADAPHETERTRAKDAAASGLQRE